MIHVDDSLLETIRSCRISSLIIQRYHSIQLRMQGLVYVGLCPFHYEKEPSFTIFNNPNGKESFYCYGCHAGNHKETGITSDIIGFYMAIENVGFNTACQQLCDIFHIPYNTVQQNPEILKLRETAYQENLRYFNNLANNKEVIDYLYQRGVKKESISYWQLGLVPHNEYYPSIRNRLVFPIIDINTKTNNVCGFGYRRLQGEIASADGQEHYYNTDEKKYRNDSNNKIFDKSKVLYGLAFAKEAIKARKSAIVVEGYIDAIIMHQSGFTNTVCAMGTSFTASQMDLLKQHTNKVFMLLDNDEAGQNAMRLIIPMLYEKGFEVFVIVPPTGMDAADMCNSFDQNQELIAKYLNVNIWPGYQFALQKSLAVYQSKTYLAKTELLQQSLPLLSNLKYIDRIMYAQYLSDCIGISPSLLAQKEVL